MTSLGIRCSNVDYSFAILSGTRESPELLLQDHIVVPKGFGRTEVVMWMCQEIQRLIDTHHPTSITMRASEARLASTSLEYRIEMEAAVYLAAGSRGLKAVFKKRRNTIAKDLGLTGRAKYLSTKLDTSVLSGFDNLPDKVQDAVHAAWSELSPGR